MTQPITEAPKTEQLVKVVSTIQNQRASLQKQLKSNAKQLREAEKQLLSALTS